MPLLHVPEAALDELGKISRYKFTLLEDQQELGKLKTRDSKEAWAKIVTSIKEQIDPRTLPIKTLQEVCDRVGISLDYATDRLPSKKRRLKRGVNRREKRKMGSVTFVL